MKVRAKQNGPEHIALLRLGQRRARERRLNGEGFIYAAELPGTDIIKIGFSLMPEKRVRGVSIQNYARAQLLAKTPGTEPAERALHKVLREHCRLDLPGFEFYPRAILSHPAIPSGLRVPGKRAA